MKRLILFLAIAFLSSCAITTKNPAPGYTAASLPGVKNDLATSCWYCGDYTGPVTGSSSLGSPQRICGSGPRWSGSCPSTASLGDGSSWQLSGGCRCDG